MNTSDFNCVISSQRIIGFSRRGKYLVIELENAKLLLVHFKMTGSFLIGNESDTPPKHSRAIINFRDGRKLFFVDPRKFGRFQLINKGESPLGELGIEPLSENFSIQTLEGLLSKRKTPIKIALLDQKLVAGIGNMYADEALFNSHIHPERPADSLTSSEVSRLFKAIHQVLRKAIQNKGASVVNYFRPGGQTGSAHSYFKVAHRKGKCLICPATVKRIVIRGRGTYYCPSCQH